MRRSRSLNSPYVTAERGNHRHACSGARAVGRIQVSITGSADLGRASPSANPVSSTRGGLVELKRIVVAVLCGVGLTAPAGASASPSGGAYSSQPASITGVLCVAGCASADAARAGSLLRVRGSAMRDVTKIVFLGATGDDDDVVAPVLKARRRSVDVAVPERAASGRLRAINNDGARSTPSRTAVSVHNGSPSAALDVTIVGRRVFYDAARPARVDLLAREAMGVSVSLVRLADGAVVQAWPVALAAGAVSSVIWDGRVAGAPQPA